MLDEILENNKREYVLQKEYLETLTEEMGQTKKEGALFLYGQYYSGTLEKLKTLKPYNYDKDYIKELIEELKDEEKDTDWQIYVLQKALKR